jgi:RimJ/RimL family protein N-acetyltransferase
MPVITTERLHLREMGPADLDDMAALLGDPAVMRYYPAPKSRAAALGWIEWNVANYAEHGFGLWVVETADGAFVGDCGLTVQRVDGVDEVELGYHVRPELQGRGLASEAAAACVRFAAERGIRRIVAIVHPDNAASQKVARNCGLELEKTSDGNRIFAAAI